MSRTGTISKTVYKEPAGRAIGVAIDRQWRHKITKLFSRCTRIDEPWKRALEPSSQIQLSATAIGGSIVPLETQELRSVSGEPAKAGLRSETKHHGDRVGELS
jgi:hypothetical protein